MPFVEVIRGVWRKIVKVDGSTKPMGGPNTTVPAWMSTAPYDPLNGEVIAGIDGSDRVQLAQDGKLYPPLCSGGKLPPTISNLWAPNARTVLAEIVAGGAAVALATTTTYTEVEIVQPPTATLTINGAATIIIPAPGVTIVHRMTIQGDITAQAGVASCWLIKTGMGQVASTAARS